MLKINLQGTLGVTIKLNLNYPRKLAVSTQGAIDDFHLTVTGEVFVSLASKNGKKQGDGIAKMLVDGSSYVNMLTGIFLLRITFLTSQEPFSTPLEFV